ncbi:MAG: hypothetical protein LW832_02415 [Parachlamydia sp.]|jgi:hypothetical protein|nr:hypothetical protein [Parachlamydia sp.]
MNVRREDLFNDPLLSILSYTASGLSEDIQEIKPVNETCLKLSPAQRKACLISAWISNTALFLGSSAYIGVEALGDRNIEGLTSAALLNGLSTAAFIRLALNKEVRKKLNSWGNACAYPVIFAGSQVYLNLAEGPWEKFYAVPYMQLLGSLLSKDVFALLSLKQADMPLHDFLPESKEPLPTLGFHTRDHSKKALIWLGAVTTAAVALSAFALLYKIDPNEPMHDVVKLGLPQDIAALFAGSCLGDILARLMDNLKERLEKENGYESTFSLKALRGTKGFFELFTILIVEGLLAIEAPPNTPSSWSKHLCVGAFHGASLLVARRRFENGPVEMEEAIPSPQLNKMKDKVCSIAKRYMPIISIYGALVGYMAWVATTNTIRADGAIIIFLTTWAVSFIITEFIAVKHQPKTDHRMINEISFRTIYASAALCIYFQFLSSKLSVGDRHLNSDSPVLYGLDLLVWLCLAGNFGNSLAVNLNEMETPPITPPYGMQILYQQLIKNFS